MILYDAVGSAKCPISGKFDPQIAQQGCLPAAAAPPASRFFIPSAVSRRFTRRGLLCNGVRQQGVEKGGQRKGWDPSVPIQAPF